MKPFVTMLGRIVRSIGDWTILSLLALSVVGLVIAGNSQSALATVASLATLGLLGLALVMGRLRGDAAELEQEQALRRQVEDRGAQVTDLLPVYWYVFDMVEARTVSSNRDPLAFLGHPPDTPIPDGVLATFMHPDDRARFVRHAERLRQAADGEVLEFDYRMRRGDGTWCWHTSRDKAFARGADGLVRQIIGAAWDISAHKQAEEALQVSEKRFRALIERSYEVTALIDERGVFRYLSPSVQRVLGYQPEELVGRNGFDFIHPDETAERQAVLADLLQRPGESSVTVFRFRGQQGDYRYLEAIGTNHLHDPAIQAIVVNFRDVSERHAAEEKLRTNQRFIEAITAASPHTMYVFDRLERRMVWANRHLTQDLDYTLQDIQDLGADFMPKLMHPDDLALLPANLARWETAADEQVLETEFRMKHADGGWRWFLSHDTVFARTPDGAVQQIIGTTKDITERKQAEAAVRESEDRFRTLFEHAPEAIVLFDVEVGRFVDVNDNACRLFGMSREELLRHGPVDLSPPLQPDGRPSAECGPEKVQQALAGLANRFEWVHRDAAGRDIPCDVFLVQLPAAGRTLLRGSIVDISERLRAQEAIRRSEKQYRDLVETSHDLIWSVDTEGRWTFVNRQAAQAIYGYEVEEMLGRPFTDFETPQQIELDLEVFAAIKSGQPVFGHETTHIRRDGTPVILSYNAIPLHNEQGQVVGTTGTATNITERKRIEAEREALIKELEAKNAELEQFTYTVSHDLKSPLITIKGFLGHLEKDLQAGRSAAAQEDIAEIGGAADRMKLLLDELLKLSRVGRIVNPPEDVPLGDLAEEAVRMLAGPLTQRGVAVTIQDDLPIIRCDRVRLLEVLQNLVDNAVQFMGEQAEPRVEIGVRQDGAQPVCFVRDNGIGIAPRFHEKIFGLFEQLEPTRGGTGIGLALVRRIVEVHGGRIWVESAGTGTGSAFCFTVPIVERQDD